MRFCRAARSTRSRRRKEAEDFFCVAGKVRLVTSAATCRTGLLLLALYCALIPEAGAISLQSDGRALEVEGSGQYQGPQGVVSTHFDETVAPPSFEVWDASLMGQALLDLPTMPPFGPTEFCGAEAGQISVMSLNGFSAYGYASLHSSLSGENVFGLNPHASGLARSVFDLLFVVNDPIHYQLTGQLQAADPSDPRDHATLVFTLVGSHDLLNLTERDYANGQFSDSGLLGPGLYRLTASAFASADVDRHDGAFLFADFSVSAEFTPAQVVPEGDLPFWMVAFLFLTLCGVARLSNTTAGIRQLR